MRRIRLDDGSTWPDPLDQEAAEARHCARYNLATLTQLQAYDILAYAEAYLHLASHPAGTESCIATLRKLRRAALTSRSIRSKP